jgi:hypothetical protein
MADTTSTDVSSVMKERHKMLYSILDCMNLSILRAKEVAPESITPYEPRKETRVLKKVNDVWTLVTNIMTDAECEWVMHEFDVVDNVNYMLISMACVQKTRE